MKRPEIQDIQDEFTANTWSSTARMIDQIWRTLVLTPFLDRAAEWFTGTQAPTRMNLFRIMTQLSGTHRTCGTFATTQKSKHRGLGSRIPGPPTSHTMQHPCTLVEGLTYVWWISYRPDPDFTKPTRLFHDFIMFTSIGSTSNFEGFMHSREWQIIRYCPRHKQENQNNPFIFHYLFLRTNISRFPSAKSASCNGWFNHQGIIFNRSAGFITLFGERPWLRPYITYERPVSGGPDNPWIGWTNTNLLTNTR